jgi:hypothetical protein
MARHTDRYPAVSFPLVAGNGKLLAGRFRPTAFLASRGDFAANPEDHGVFPAPSAALVRTVEGVEMTVPSSFSPLPRPGRLRGPATRRGGAATMQTHAIGLILALLTVVFG